MTVTTGDLELSAVAYGGLSRETPSLGVVVLLPTYNERDNLPAVYRRLRLAFPDLGILVIDDNSPDGTGRIAEDLADRDRLLWVLHRPAKAGLGTAYLEGMSWAMRYGASAVVEMDVDGSHRPEELNRLIKAWRAGSQLVIGSRYVANGESGGWSSHRRVLSRAGNRYARTMLSIEARDVTSGYRLYAMEALGPLLASGVESRGYCFQIELCWRAKMLGLCVREVPISFHERREGESKLTIGVAWESWRRVTAWGLRARCRRWTSRATTAMTRPKRVRTAAEFR